MGDFHVIIIGGGLGGLSLAQGLKKNGISCAVYEKASSKTDRLQGYRIVLPPPISSIDWSSPSVNLAQKP